MKSIDEMTLEERAGQLFIYGFNGIRMNDYLREIITEWKIGGLVFSIRNVENPIQVRDLIAEMQELALRENGIPLFVAINQEGGDRTCFLESLSRNPGNMAIGATHDPKWAYEVAVLVGRELKALGFNMLFMPVLDLSKLVDNSVLGIRSYSDDPQMAAEMGAKFVEGLREAGIASTAKHFPGAGGSAKDAHWELPYIDRTYDELEAFELLPFKKAIEAGVSAMMTAHAVYTRIDENIATLSKRINTEIAKDRLGFEGIMISDAFGMHGLIDHVSPLEACVRAVRAGIDVILNRHGRRVNFNLLKTLRQAIQTGQIQQERVQDALRRIFTIKTEYYTDKNPEISTAIWNDAHISKLEAMGEASVTLVRNDEGLIPLKVDHSKKVLLIMPDVLANASLDGIIGDQAGYIIRGILSDKYSYDIDVFDLIHYNLEPYQEEIEKIIQKARDYDIIILGSHKTNIRPAQSNMLKKIFKLDKRVIWIALNWPYDLLEYPDAKTYLCTYGDRTPQLKALCRILGGEITPRGSLPTAIREHQEAGEGIHHYNE